MRKRVLREQFLRGRGGQRGLVCSYRKGFSEFSERRRFHKERFVRAQDCSVGDGGLLIRGSRRKLWGLRQGRSFVGKGRGGVIRDFGFSDRVVLSRVVSRSLRDERRGAYNLALRLFAAGWATRIELFSLPLVGRYKDALPYGFLVRLKKGLFETRAQRQGGRILPRIARVRDACVRSMGFCGLLSSGVTCLEDKRVQREIRRSEQRKIMLWKVGSYVLKKGDFVNYSSM